MNFRDKYQNYNEAVTPDPVLVRTLTETIAEQERDRREGRREVIFRVVRGFTAVAALCLCVTIVVPVLAASGPIYQLMSLVSLELAQRFRPVQEADEDKGIRMEVVSAYIHDNEAQVYVTLQDLTGDRIDETIDLYDSYFIQTPFDCSASCVTLGYDSETRTATLLITIRQWGDREIAGDKVTFSIRGFISHKETYKNLEIPIPLTETEENPEARMEYLNGRGGGMPWEKSENSGNTDDAGTELEHEDLEKIETVYDTETSGIPKPITRVLVPGEADPRFPVEGIAFTGMGYVDGLLHIQLAVPNRLRNDNHGHVFLRDAEGNLRGYEESVYFRKWVDREEEEPVNTRPEEEHVSYMEFIFDISPEELAGYRIYGDFVTSGVQVEGKWSVTIPLEEE